MPVRGPLPKDNRVGHTPRRDWTEVPDVPFDGPLRRELPRRKGFRWHPEVVAWWATVSRMPQCALWSETDWQFAVELAYLKHDWWRDFDDGRVESTKSTEIRRREDMLGTTADARRRLRVRYVEPKPEAQALPATVSSIRARRARLSTS